MPFSCKLPTYLSHFIDMQISACVSQCDAPCPQRKQILKPNTLLIKVSNPHKLLSWTPKSLMFLDTDQLPVKWKIACQHLISPHHSLKFPFCRRFFSHECSFSFTAFCRPSNYLMPFSEICPKVIGASSSQSFPEFVKRFRNNDILQLA